MHRALEIYRKGYRPSNAEAVVDEALLPTKDAFTKIPYAKIVEQHHMVLMGLRPEEVRCVVQLAQPFKDRKFRDDAKNRAVAALDGLSDASDDPVDLLLDLPSYNG